MGHTHYWNNLKFAKSGWNELSTMTKLLLSLLPENVKLDYDPDSEDVVEVSKQFIHFNGAGDEACESFCLSFRSSAFTFCKTNHRPYNFAVCCVLILASYCSESGEISSDGIGENYTEPEWTQAWNHLSCLLLLTDREKAFKAFKIKPEL